MNFMGTEGILRNSFRIVIKKGTLNYPPTRNHARGLSGQANQPLAETAGLPMIFTRGGFAFGEGYHGLKWRGVP